jgi:hypothetical protein
VADWDHAETITFTLDVDGQGVRRIVVDRFPDAVVFDGAFLDQSDPRVVRRDLARNTISVHAANGTAVYGIVAFANDAYLCERIEP